VNPTLTAARLGFVRGRIELRQNLTYVPELISQAFFIALGLSVLVILRNHVVPGTDFSLSSSILPSAIGMNVAFTGLMGVSTQLTMDRDDGTLLRAKAIPDGMVGYIVGKIVTFSGRMLIGIFILLVGGVLLFKGVAVSSVGAWLTIAWVLPLGLVATLPVGIVLGSLVTNTRLTPLVIFGLVGVLAISGVFYPITHLPVLLQGVGQVFPMYWLGLGMRSALLPHTLAAVEIGRSWRHWQTAGVLGAWAIAGVCTAPIVLRRMARRESGASLTARREKILRKVG
jgi:ABC-2 type transport system permease protein